jgi:hypothetical protein
VKKRYVLTSIIVMSFLFFGGLIMLFSSTALGESAGGRAIHSNGGSMDTQQYINIINSTTDNFRTAGTIISLVGGFGVLLGGYGIYKEI